MTSAALWLAVVGSGLYHGASPAMGWPLAVSAGLMGRGRRDLVAALVPLALGHLLAMAAMLAPFALAAGLALHQRQVRLAAAALVTAWGVWLLVWPRHPRALARIPPGRLALWSFAIATAHGAGLMLLPIYLGLCRAADPDAGHRAAAALIAGDLGRALLVALVHAAAMIAAGGALALAVHGWLGLKAFSRTWFNLDRVWAASLAGVGALAFTLAWMETA